MISARLDLEPKEAVEYFAGKGNVLSWDYTDVWRETNAHAFTVAKATSMDVLQAIRSEVSKAVGPGQTFDAFKKTLRPRLEQMGWWGKQEALDIDTGEITKVQLGSVRRLRTIYQTNVQTSYMAGRYKRYVDNAVSRPYWRYVAIMDGRTRPAHAALHGKVFRWDDPIWSIIFPPNGWGCRCRVVALTEAEFRALGVPLEDGRDRIVTKEVAINRDGDTVTVKGLRYTGADGKDGVFWPDPGWDYNPGEAWASFDKHASVPDCDWGGQDGSASFAEGGKVCLAGVPGQKTWLDFGRPAIADVPNEHRLSTPAVLRAEPDRNHALQALASRLGVSGESPLRIVQTPVDQVSIRYEWLHHIVEKDRDARERYADFIIPTLESPFEVWLSEYDDGFRHRYIGLFDDADFLTIVRLNKDGSLLWNVMRTGSTYLDRQRLGQLLYGK